MKKCVLLAIVVLSTLDVFSQIEKGVTLVSGEGNYHQSTTEYGVTTSHNTVHGKYLNVGATVGYSMTDWSTDNPTWMVNFNPSHWTLGVKAIL